MASKAHGGWLARKFLIAGLVSPADVFECALPRRETELEVLNSVLTGKAQEHAASFHNPEKYPDRGHQQERTEGTVIGCHDERVHWQGAE